MAKAKTAHEPPPRPPPPHCTFAEPGTASNAKCHNDLLEPPPALSPSSSSSSSGGRNLASSMECSLEGSVCLRKAPSRPKEPPPIRPVSAIPMYSSATLPSKSSASAVSASLPPRPPPPQRPRQGKLPQRPYSCATLPKARPSKKFSDNGLPPPRPAQPPPLRHSIEPPRTPPERPPPPRRCKSFQQRRLELFGAKRRRQFFELLSRETTDDAILMRESQFLDEITSELSKTLKEMEERLYCPVCMDRFFNAVFQCGHVICRECSEQLTACPICRSLIIFRVLLHW